MMSRLSISLGILLLASCTSEPVRAPEPAAATERQNDQRPSQAATTGAAANEAKARPSDAPAGTTAEPARAIRFGEDGLPLLDGETGCAMMRWSTSAPKWEREPVQWDEDTRTLSFAGTTRRFDEAMRVRDFGEGGERIAYDDAGNMTERGRAEDEHGRLYKYRNHYDAKKRLVRVDVSTRGRDGKLSAFQPFRSYRYDARGRVEGIDVQVVPQDPLVHVSVERDEAGRIVKLTWGEPSAARQLEMFHYDERGRLVRYERDGLVVPRGKPADGVLDWVSTWEHDAQGMPKRVDGVEGTDPERVPHETTLFGSGCLALGKLWPELFVYPYLPLPAAASPDFLSGS